MTTDKELADAYRLVKVDAWGREGGASARAFATERINKLDPPKSTYPEGTIAWVTYADAISRPYQALARYDADENEWVMERTHNRAACTVTGDNVTKVEPLRVLGDNEIAIPRIDVDYMGPHDTTAKFMREAANRARDLGHGSCVTEAVQAVLRAYADALDAEAGDAK